jgi:predicted RNA-binding protein YlqC (UPF0109 family)
MKSVQENQESIASELPKNDNYQLLSFNDILNCDNIENYKILSFLIVQDSISSSNVHLFYRNFCDLINNNQISVEDKLSLLAIMINDHKSYIDYVLEIFIDITDEIIKDLEISPDLKIKLLKNIAIEFDFIASDKNEVGRIYGKEERILKAIFQLVKIITPKIKDPYQINDFNDLTKLKIYKKIQDFLIIHFTRTNEIYENLIKKDQFNKFIINEEKVLEYNQKNQHITNINQFCQKLIAILNDEKLFINHKAQFILIVIATTPYLKAICFINGILELSIIQNIDFEIDQNILITKNYYRDLYKKEIIAVKKTFELSNVGKKTKIFYNNAKEEIEINIDQLNATANLIKSNLVE